MARKQVGFLCIIIIILVALLTLHNNTPDQISLRPLPSKKLTVTTSSPTITPTQTASPTYTPVSNKPTITPSLSPPSKTPTPLLAATTPLIPSSTPSPEATVTIQTQSATSTIVAPRPSAPPSLTPQRYDRRLVIPVLGIDAPVVLVGVDEYGMMEGPTGWYDIALFRYSSRPGTPGSAAFAGHLDTNTGAPATFWALSQLAIGDEVIYHEIDGTRYTFIVEEVAVYQWDQVPKERVFGRGGDPRIALITCGGTWSRQNRNYSHRTIVYARMP